MNEETIANAAAAAAKQGAVSEPKQRTYQRCPCGVVPEQLMLEVDRNAKVARASCGTCGTWGVDFLRGLSTEPEQILDKAQLAWDAAPRSIAS